MNAPKLFLLLSSLLFGSSQFTNADGWIAIKKQIVDETRESNLYRFKDSNSAGLYTDVTFLDGVEKRVYTAQIVWSSPLISVKEETIRPDAIGFYKLHLQNLNGFLKEAPKYEEALASQKNILVKIVKNLSDGNTFYKGSWIDDSEYLEKLERLRTQEEKRRARAMETEREAKKAKLKSSLSEKKKNLVFKIKNLEIVKQKTKKARKDLITRKKSLTDDLVRILETK